MTGIYGSKVSSKSKNAVFPWVFDFIEKFDIEISQEDDKITGKFLNLPPGEINGILSNNKFIFNWSNEQCWHGKGELIVPPDGTKLNGTWTCLGTTGNWTMRKKRISLGHWSDE